MANNDDRRARRSRKMLKQGLLELMKEKKFSGISVKDITERMDLNRGTFYLHYPDTTALLQSVENDILDEVQGIITENLDRLEGSPNLGSIFRPLLDYIVLHREDFKTLLANNSTSNFIDRFQLLIQKDGLAYIHEKYGDISEDRLDYLLSYIGYGLIGLLKHWFDNDMSISKEDMIRYAEILVNNTSENFFTNRV